MKYFFKSLYLHPLFNVTCIGDIFHSTDHHLSTCYVAENMTDSEFITTIIIVDLPISDGRLVEKLCCLPKLQMGKRLDSH